MSIFKKLEKDHSIKLYRTIKDLPIWNWNETKKTGDKRYLIRLDDYDDLPKVKVPEELWRKLLNEYNNEFQDLGSIGNFGYEKFIEHQMLIKEELIASCDDNNPMLSSIITKRKMVEKELENLPKSSQTLEEQAIHMEIFFKIQFDVKLISTYRWFKYTQEYERRIKELEEQKRRSRSPKKT